MAMSTKDFANFATSNRGLWARPTLVTLGVKSGDVSVNVKKGIIEGYLTKYFIPGTQTPVVDPYKDIVEVGAFTKTIKELTTGRDTKGLDYLMPHLWQHNPNEIIGGDTWLVEDKHGVILEVQLAKGVRRADEALELIEQKMLPGISYGYDAIRAPIINGIRHLKEVALHESSSVTFPANEYAGITAVKSVFYVGGIDNASTRPLAIASVDTVEDALETKDTSPVSFSDLQDGHAYSDAMSQFFNLTDMLGQAIISQMMNDAADSVQAQIDQFAVAVQAWSDEFCDVLCPPDGTDPMNSMMPTSGMGYMSAYHLSGVDRLPDVERKFTPEALEKIQHTVKRLQNILETSPKENYSIASLKNTYQHETKAPVTDRWSRIAPPPTPSGTPLGDERYSIQSLIKSVKSALVE